MSNIPKKYKIIHKMAFENEKQLKEAKKCVCFYCEERFDVSKIKDWIEDKHGLTAQCPFCQIDSVIPEIIDGTPISDDDLKKLYKYYF